MCVLGRLLYTRINVGHRMIHIELMLNVFGQEKHEAGDYCYLKIERHGHVHKHSILDEIFDSGGKSFKSKQITLTIKIFPTFPDKIARLLLKFPKELSKLLSSTELLSSTHSTRRRSLLYKIK